MKVYLLGAGPGDPELITLKAKKILALADTVVYDALANAVLLQETKADAEKIYVGKIADQHALTQKEINALLIRKAKEGKIVARLKGGDPYIFGRGGEEALALLEAGVPFEEVPGISSAIAAPAYAGIPLTHRDFTSSVTIITGHEDPSKNVSAHNWQALAQSSSTLVFVMGMKNLPHIVANLLEAGLDPQTPAAVIYRGTTSSQRSLVSTLHNLPEAVQQAKLTNPSVIVVGQVVTLHDQLNWFEQKELFGRSIVVTRAREQASDMVRSLEALGAEVLQCPVIKIVPLEDYQALDDSIRNLATYDWLIFTSANGVRSFWQRLTTLNLDSRVLARSKVAAIGPATAQTLAEYGIKADLIPSRYVAEEVVQAFLQATDHKTQGLRILLPRAEQARDVLPVGLRQAGCVVDVLAAYRTIPDSGAKETVLQKLEAGQLDCVTFASSSTVDNFLQLVPPAKLLAHPETVLAAIGPITAATLRKYGLNCTIQPDKYTIPALVEAVRKFFNKN